jgi:hypothetical protein
LTDSSIHHSDPRRLANLLAVDGSGPGSWTQAEYADMLRHQLAAPLSFDLETLTSAGEPTVAAMVASCNEHEPLVTFQDLLQHPRPPIELLCLAKEFAKSSRSNRRGTLPPEVATVLYLATLAVALLRHGQRIAHQDDAGLRKGLQWALNQAWIDDRVRQLFAEGLSCLGQD